MDEQKFIKKYVKDFSKPLAKKHGLTDAETKKILVYLLRNVLTMIKRGEDVRIPRFGHFYFDKKHFHETINRAKQDLASRESKSFSVSSGDTETFKDH